MLSSITTSVGGLQISFELGYVEYIVHTGQSWW
jgi:hypothetical protein